MQIDWRYGLLTAALLAFVFGLSSIPDVDRAFHSQTFQLLFNILHAPLFGAVAFCGYRTFSRGRDGSIAVAALTFVAAGAYAVLDEWHQSFVAGRNASLSDLVVDVAGITVVLLVAIRSSRGRSRMGPHAAARDRSAVR